MSIQSKKVRRHFRRTVRKDRLAVMLINDDRSDDSVLVLVKGWGVYQWADYDGYFLGSSWETDIPGEAWTLLYNYPALAEEAQAAGYRVNFRHYVDPPSPDQSDDGESACFSSAGALGATLCAAREACLSCVVRDIVDACEYEITKGAILHAADHLGDVTAGNGMVVDWRVIKSGQVVLEGASPRQVAETFVRIARPEMLTKALLRLDP